MSKVRFLGAVALSLSLTSLAAPAADFVKQDEKKLPEVASVIPMPPVPLPEGALDLSFDRHGNFWALSAPEKGKRSVLLLKAQDQQAWVVNESPGLDPRFRPKTLVVDDVDCVWITDGSQLFRNNPKEAVWVNMSVDSGFPQGRITALGPSPKGGVAMGLSTGHLVEFLQTKPPRSGMRNSLSITPGFEPIQAFVTDRDGSLWVKAKNGIFKRESPADAWQRTWEIVSHMPAGSHDLSGDVLDGNFYMMWAISGDFGYPSKGTFHRHLLGYNAETATWRKVADFGLPRGYGGSGVLDGKIWAVGGDARDEEKKRYTTTLTQIIDPKTGNIEKGPDIPARMPATICLSSGGRLYALGYEKGVKVKKGETAPKNVLNIFSIGKGETTWTEEPDGPEGGGSAYGVELNGKLYFVVDHRYMAIFDTVSKTWETTKAPHSPRSPSVGHYKGEIWVMGGRSSEGGSVTYIYNPTSKDWRKGPDLPSPTMWGCAFTIDGKLYVPGGAGPKHGHMVFHSRTLRLREK